MNDIEGRHLRVLVALAADVGRLLGRGHGRADFGAASRIIPAVESAKQAHVARAIADATALVEDHARFRGLLATHGPLLAPPSLAY